MCTVSQTMLEILLRKDSEAIGTKEGTAGKRERSNDARLEEAELGLGEILFKDIADTSLSGRRPGICRSITTGEPNLYEENRGEAAAAADGAREAGIEITAVDVVGLAVKPESSAGSSMGEFEDFRVGVRSGRGYEAKGSSGRGPKLSVYRSLSKPSGIGQK